MKINVETDENLKSGNLKKWKNWEILAGNEHWWLPFEQLGWTEWFKGKSRKIKWGEKWKWYF